MSQKKLHIGLLFGGRSAEHEVSILSAKNVFEAIDRDKFEVSLFGIDKKGGWHHFEPKTLEISTNNPNEVKLVESEGSKIALAPEAVSSSFLILSEGVPKSLDTVDVVFPILHGPYGEDGTVQGLLKTLDIPFVGPGVLGSSVAMDKDVAKRLLRDAGIPIADFEVITQSSQLSFEEVSKKLGSPLFVKPANMGSSVGVAKVANAEEYQAALKDAFKYDTKLVVEEAIVGRELECSVLGNEDPKASMVGEILTQGDHEFYSYDSKYVDAEGSKTWIPDDLPDGASDMIRELAVKAFKALCCEGMARVDFFLEESGRAVINEINTIPGFTNISMYPKLWEASGISYSELITQLIELAVSRHERDSKLSTTA